MNVYYCRGWTPTLTPSSYVGFLLNLAGIWARHFFPKASRSSFSDLLRSPSIALQKCWANPFDKNGLFLLCYFAFFCCVADSISRSSKKFEVDWIHTGLQLNYVSLLNKHVSSLTAGVQVGQNKITPIYFSKGWPPFGFCYQPHSTPNSQQLTMSTK